MSETTPAPTSQDPAHNQQNSDKWMWAAVYLGGVALFGFILATFANKGGQGGPGSERSGLAVGEKAPVITAKGWVNGDAPAMEDLKGKVIVVDAWATWCYPCKLEAPKLVKTYKKYQYNPDVVFIGLTSDEIDSMAEIVRFLEETGVTWPNGYGATQTLADFKAHYIPAMWVINKEGTVCWNYDAPGSMENAINQALK